MALFVCVYVRFHFYYYSFHILSRRTEFATQKNIREESPIGKQEQKGIWQNSSCNTNWLAGGKFIFLNEIYLRFTDILLPAISTLKIHIYFFIFSLLYSFAFEHIFSDYHKQCAAHFNVNKKKHT